MGTELKVSAGQKDILWDGEQFRDPSVSSRVQEHPRSRHSHYGSFSLKMVMNMKLRNSMMQ